MRNSIRYHQAMATRQLGQLGQPGQRSKLCWLCLIALTTMGLLSIPVVAQELAAPPIETAQPKTKTAETQQKTVAFQIDYGDGFSKRYGQIPWKENLRIIDLMEAASQHVQPTKFETRGREATAFLTSIDGIENQGFGKKCWIFSVNEQKGEASFGTVKVKPGDRILWKYQTFP